jgi:hypothetical protein
VAPRSWPWILRFTQDDSREYCATAICGVDKSVRTFFLAVFMGSPAVFAAEPVTEDFGFSLIPNAFSRNPSLSMTVYTELTERGRQVPPASAAAPVYFVISPTPAVLQDTLFQSLAGGGYQPAPEGQPAGLALVYYWGSHQSMDPDLGALFPERNRQYFMERAYLVGGRAYRHEIMNQFNYGYTFADRTPRKNFLINQVSDDIYFVIVSAYDYAALAAGERRLLWRTMMTVATNGVSMKDSLPPLILTAGPYFGRETAEPVALHRRARRGTVTLGPLKIVADDIPQRPVRK